VSQEGTHGIQGLDLLGRKVLLADGAALNIVLDRMRAGANAATQYAALSEMATQLIVAIEDLTRATQQAWSSGNAQETLANASGYLRGFGHVVLAWIWLELAQTSQRALEKGGADLAFHRGKLAAARYFFTFELPLAAVWLQPVARCEDLLRSVDPHWL